MAQLHFYLPDEQEKRLRERAARSGQPLSRYLAGLVSESLEQKQGWPEGYFEEVFGTWEGGPLSRQPQGELDS